MKTTNPPGDLPEISDRDAVLALRAMLRDNLELFPLSPEDIKEIEEELGGSFPAPLSPTEFRTLLAQRCSGERHVTVHPPASAAEEFVADFAQAARNGHEIPEDLLKKMREKRRQAQARRDGPNSSDCG